MADDRIAALRRGYEAFNRGDMDGVFVDVDPGFVVADRAEVPDPQVLHGVEGAKAALQRLHEEFDDYRFEIEEVIEVGDQLVFVLRQSGRGKLSGVDATGPIVHLWGFRGDRIASLRAFSDRDEAVAAARASSPEG